MSAFGGRREVVGGMDWECFYAKQYNSKSFLVRFL
jgi:hypothetical protein